MPRSSKFKTLETHSMLVAIKLFQKANSFQDRLQIWTCRKTGLCFRLMKLGFQLLTLFTNDLKVETKIRNDLWEWMILKVLLLRNIHRYQMKNDKERCQMTNMKCSKWEMTRWRNDFRIKECSIYSNEEARSTLKMRVFDIWVMRGCQQVWDIQWVVLQWLL